jgi:hypothetical protein
MLRTLRPAVAALAVAGALANGFVVTEGVVQAAPPASAQICPVGPIRVRLAVDPAPEPRPALQYSFLTPAAARKPGNAATFYYRAILAYTLYRAVASNAKGGKSLDERLDEWREMPLDQLPREEIRRVVNGFAAYGDLREAASRERCDWDWQLQGVEGIKVVEFLLTEVQESRGLARFLAVKARLEIAERRYADAVETLGIGYQLAHDLGDTPLLISGLVGVAVANMLDDQVHEFFAAPKSPNLYWAYTELPRPLVDMRPAVEFESNFPARVFPMLKDPQHAEHSPEQWAEIISDACSTLFRLAGDTPASNVSGWQQRLLATGLALRGYTQAKRELIAAGYDAAKVEQMPVGQVIAVHEADLSRYVADEMRKWTLVPYPEGRRRMNQVNKELIRDRFIAPGFSSREVIPINSQLLPVVTAAVDAGSRCDVLIAADRVIEAIRMHAAVNDGKLPQTLAEITVVPVPNQPQFGTPFPYTLEGEKATLEVRRRSEPPAALQDGDYVFEITIAHDRQ